eukprot:1556319-Amphidinium_carterae.1
MSLPRVAENDVMEMDVSSPSDANLSFSIGTHGEATASTFYAVVENCATSASTTGTGWSWQASSSAAASSGAAA